jgi:hypothetical protein
MQGPEQFIGVMTKMLQLATENITSRNAPSHGNINLEADTNQSRWNGEWKVKGKEASR